MDPVVFCGAEKRVEFGKVRRSLEEWTDSNSWLKGVWQFFNSIETSNKKLVERSLISLQNWCLLPMKCSKGKYLLPIAKSCCVIPLYNESTFIQNLVQLLCKLDIAQPFDHSDDFIQSDFTWYYSILGSIEKPVSIVLALEEVLRQNSTALIGKLDKVESATLLSYLSEQLANWNGVPHSIETVQKLPFFMTVCEQLVPIHECCVYVLSQRIPTTEMESWTASKERVFLKNEIKLQALLKYLNCKFFTDTEVYVSFILQHFELLTTEGQLEHLIFVRDELLPLLKDKVKNESASEQIKRETELAALKECLFNLAFVPTEHGCMKQASNFYDPTIDIFVVMHEPSDFPPKSFQTFNWHQFLRDCGMISCVT